MPKNASRSRVQVKMDLAVALLMSGSSRLRSASAVQCVSRWQRLSETQWRCSQFFGKYTQGNFIIIIVVIVVVVVHEYQSEKAPDS